MDQAAIMKLGTALAVSYAVYHFGGKYPAVRAAALGVMGVIVAKQIPYVQAALA